MQLSKSANALRVKAFKRLLQIANSDHPMAADVSNKLASFLASLPEDETEQLLATLKIGKKSK
jgi:hypothetical protein